MAQQLTTLDLSQRAELQTIRVIFELFLRELMRLSPETRMEVLNAMMAHSVNEANK